MKVKAYFNLHSSKWSVVALEGDHKGRVIAHCDRVQLLDIEFKVSAKGRDRVLKEKRKNVHAFAIGRLYAWEGTTRRYELGRMYLPPMGWRGTSDTQVSYNPYKTDTFYVKETGQAIHDTRVAFLESDRQVYVR